MSLVTELLSDPKRCCRGWPARDQQGNGCKIDSSKAVAWSLLGAIMLYYGDGKLKVYRRIHRWLEQHGFVGPSGYAIPICFWTDAPERTHSELMAMCRELGI